ncbi:MAG: hypothetical protein Q8L36_00570 [bacterium]|nr:hypothetical protein [bacterium]
MNPLQKKLIVGLLLFAGTTLILLGIAIISRISADGGRLSGELVPLAILNCLCLVICAFASISLAFCHGIDEGIRKGMGQPLTIRDLSNVDTFVSLKSFSELNESGVKTGNFIHLLRNGKRELLLVVLPAERMPGCFQVFNGEIVDSMSLNPINGVSKLTVVVSP